MNMDRVQRLATIARMLPAILKSAQSYCDASRKLSEYPREFDVLQGYALEEAAKALILLDVVRCPPKRWNHSRRIVKRAVQHLARLIYAEMVGLRPANLEEIRTYVDAARQSHYLEGDLGEFIAANTIHYMSYVPRYTLLTKAFLFRHASLCLKIWDFL